MVLSISRWIIISDYKKQYTNKNSNAFSKYFIVYCTHLMFQIVKVAKNANSHEFIRKFQSGCETKVGEEARYYLGD